MPGRDRRPRAGSDRSEDAAAKLGRDDLEHDGDEQRVDRPRREAAEGDRGQRDRAGSAASPGRGTSTARRRSSRGTSAAAAAGDRRRCRAARPRAPSPPKAPNIRPRSVALPYASCAKTARTTGIGASRKFVTRTVSTIARRRRRSQMKRRPSASSAKKPRGASVSALARAAGAGRPSATSAAETRKLAASSQSAAVAPSRPRARRRAARR